MSILFLKSLFYQVFVQNLDPPFFITARCKAYRCGDSPTNASCCLFKKINDNNFSSKAFVLNCVIMIAYYFFILFNLTVKKSDYNLCEG